MRLKSSSRDTGRYLRMRILPHQDKIELGLLSDFNYKNQAWICETQTETRNSQGGVPTFLGVGGSHRRIECA
jgi:hypothetical protein